MKILYLLRHAKSSWKEENLQDFLRPLNKTGLEELYELNKNIKSFPFNPEQIYCSASIRTYQTTTNLMLNQDIDFQTLHLSKSLYLADKDTWIEQIKETNNNINELLLCGHNPGLSDLLEALSGNKWKEVPTGTLIALEVNSKWSEIIKKKTRLLYSIIPSRHGNETL
jgi:phosphohistidine phosphatase